MDQQSERRQQMQKAVGAAIIQLTARMDKVQDRLEDLGPPFEDLLLSLKSATSIPVVQPRKTRESTTS
eukprot:m.176380 g.176380  ORF g.176380 m.176380 type:complete len:68 (-) comp31847_c5_seq2:506-709(-)